MEYISEKKYKELKKHGYVSKNRNGQLMMLKNTPRGAASVPVKVIRKKTVTVKSSKKTKVVYLGSSYKKTKIASKKPKFAVKIGRPSKYMTRYAVGAQEYVVPKRGVKLRRE